MANKAIYSDLDLNFVIHPVKKDINKLNNDDAIIAAVRNLVLTNKFEYGFQPDLGSSIRQVLFENWSPALDAVLAQLISDVINNYEPRVVLQSVDVEFSEADNGYNVTISFINKLIPNQQVIGSFFLEKAR